MTTPGPCGGIGSGMGHIWMSAPPAILLIMLPIDKASAVLRPSSKVFAAGAPGVPAAARVADSAALIFVCDADFATFKAPADARGIPRHAGRKPMKTSRLPGPGKSGNIMCAVESVVRAAGIPAIVHLLHRAALTAQDVQNHSAGHDQVASVVQSPWLVMLQPTGQLTLNQLALKERLAIQGFYQE